MTDIILGTIFLGLCFVQGSDSFAFAVPNKADAFLASFRDPLEKFTTQQRDAIGKSFSDWRDQTRYPPATLTTDQLQWFFSDNDGKGRGPNVRQFDSGIKVPGAASRGENDVIREEVINHSVRKEYRQMTSEQIQRFHNVLNTMKRTFPDPQNPSSEYDIYTEIHRHANAPGAHEGPGFLGWHREYIKR